METNCCLKWLCGHTCFAWLQISFLFLLCTNFILTTSFLVFVDNESPGNIGTDDLVIPLMIASSMLLIISCVIIVILMVRRTDPAVNNHCLNRNPSTSNGQEASTSFARAEDSKMVQCRRIMEAQPKNESSPSLKVVSLSWVLTSIESILRMIGLFHFQSEALDDAHAPWWAIVIYHILVFIQTTFQYACLCYYESNTTVISMKSESHPSGPPCENCKQAEKECNTIRKSFLIMMVFMNSYMWILNVASIKIIVDLTSHNMEELLSESVERILYTANRASTLAFHVESGLLFYGFYSQGSNKHDHKNDSREPESQHLDERQSYCCRKHIYRVSRWIGGGLFFVFIFLGIGSFLTRPNESDVHYAVTVAIGLIFLIIIGITLSTTLSFYNKCSPAQGTTSTSNEQNDNRWKDLIEYMAGENVGDLRILLFYSICAVSYHLLLTLKVTFGGIHVDVYQPVREALKGLACVSLTVFMLWLSRKDRKLRCWFKLNLMLGNVIALICLELIEETFEHSFAHKDPLKLYALPLAIDFKTYVFVHSYTHVVSERRKIKHSNASTASFNRPINI